MRWIMICSTTLALASLAGQASAQTPVSPPPTTTPPPETSSSPPPASSATNPPSVANDAPPDLSGQPLAPDAPIYRTDYDHTEEEDRSLGFMWFEALGGYSYVNIAQFDKDNFLPGVVSLSDDGPTYGAAAGFRFGILTLGARVQLSNYTDFYVAAAGFDASLRIPLFFVEPYFRAGFGYGWLSLDSDVETEEDPSIYGLVVDAGLGVDIFLSSFVAIGVGVDASFLNFGRQSITDCADDECSPGTINFSDDGDAVGLQLRGQGHVSLHF